jgi:hypothetical protein
MSAESVAARQKKKGSIHRLISAPQEKILAGAIIYRDALRLDTSTTAIQEEYLTIFRSRQYLTESWISRFLRRNHLSRKSFTGAHPAEREASNRSLLINYLCEVQEFVKKGLTPDKIINVDWISIYSDARYIRQAGPRGRFPQFLEF